MRCGERLREKIKRELKWEGNTLVDEEGSQVIPVPECYEVYKLDKQSVPYWGPVKGFKLVDYVLSRDCQATLLEFTQLGDKDAKGLINETVEKFSSSGVLLMAAGFSPRRCLLKIKDKFPPAPLECLLRREWNNKWIMRDVCEIEVEVLVGPEIEE